MIVTVIVAERQTQEINIDKRGIAQCGLGNDAIAGSPTKLIRSTVNEQFSTTVLL
jgi:hypothetical protein